MNFSHAFQRIKEGFKMSRSGWNGTGQYLHIQEPDKNSKMGLPYIYISTVDKKLVPWTPSQSDLFGQDWFEIA
jgi:hypothetical protein